MADEPNEDQTKSKFQSWMNELLDKRDADKATAEDQRQQERDAEMKAARAKSPAGVLESLLGINMK
jgi:hypothetical protein